jgi:hypothetical protein
VERCTSGGLHAGCQEAIAVLHEALGYRDDLLGGLATAEYDFRITLPQSAVVVYGGEGERFDIRQ